MSTILTDDERPKLPQPHHRGPEGTGSYFDSFTAEQMESHADAREAAVLAKLAQQEPTFWQVRLRCRGNKNQAWSSWSECDERAAKAYQASTDVQWEYETRALYTHPAPQQADRQRVPDGWIEVVKAARDVLSDAEDHLAKPHSTAVRVALMQLDAMLAAAPEAPAQAGIEELEQENRLLRARNERLEKEMAEAVAAEREACAKLAEPSEEHRRDATGYLGGDEGVDLLDGIAAAIRARGAA